MVNRNEFIPLVTLLLQEKGYEGTIGVGRVQTPTVYLIYQRQKEIKNFISKPFFQLEGNFKVANGSYKGMAKIKEDSKEVVQSLLKEHELQEKIDNNGVIESVEKKKSNKKRHSSIHWIRCRRFQIRNGNTH